MLLQSARLGGFGSAATLFFRSMTTNWKEAQLNGLLVFSDSGYRHDPWNARCANFCCMGIAS